uniref:Spondin 2b, extracellular matrix protein n=1 Tax=Oncorhynchus kisutch TaxID=8019 RepID=A0A8C7D7A2_ONCKI
VYWPSHFPHDSAFLRNQEVLHRQPWSLLQLIAHCRVDPCIKNDHPVSNYDLLTHPGRRAEGRANMEHAACISGAGRGQGRDCLYCLTEGTLEVRIVPSPDWFLGVDGFNLREGEHYSCNPYDAGTHSVTQVNLKEPMITSSSPNHPANSCYYLRLKNLTPMGKVTLTKINKSLVSFPQDSTPLDCEVSVWSPWGLCKGKCGDSSVRNRTRYIHLQPANNWVVCPPLEEEMKYISNNCLCLAGRSKKQKRRGHARRQRRRKLRPSSPLEKPKL